MEQTQPQPPVQPAQPVQQPAVQQPPAGQAVSAKKSKTWLWIIGGCLIILLIAGLVIGGLIWWGARKAKKAYESNVKPQLEEMQKNAEQWEDQSEDWQKAAEEWQKEIEKVQDELPSGSLPSAN